jgi:hypothetical protein
MLVPQWLLEYHGKRVLPMSWTSGRVMDHTRSHCEPQAWSWSMGGGPYKRFRSCCGDKE